MADKSKCRTCKKDIVKFEVIRPEDLSGWCSIACFQKEDPKMKKFDASKLPK
jgi:hypothetical protein